ncbi:hypothetical protein HK28_12345 [Acetobacter sp. DsW_063]|nr:hypothetical protein HK28_12345 [Acetobacter sp. DsW_063]
MVKLPAHEIFMSMALLVRCLLVAFRAGATAKLAIPNATAICVAAAISVPTFPLFQVISTPVIGGTSAGWHFLLKIIHDQCIK